MAADVPVLMKMTQAQNSVVNNMWRLCDVTAARAARTVIDHGLRHVRVVEELGGMDALLTLFARRVRGGPPAEPAVRVLTVRLSQEMAETIIEWNGSIRRARGLSPRGHVGTGAAWLLAYGTQLLDREPDSTVIQVVNEHREKEKLAGIGPGRPRSK
jgi:hypothetical protein